MVKTNPLELDRKKQGKVTKQLAKNNTSDHGNKSLNTRP